MKTLLLCFAAAASSPGNRHPNDAAFHQWCADVGIACPGGELRTTPDSVAGRGVFSTRDLAPGDEIISIPLYAACTQATAAGYFPALGEELKKCRRRRGKRRMMRRVWNWIRRRPVLEDDDADDYWQAELTAYALEALRVDHPWATWIKQWRRDDPMQALADERKWKDDDGAAMATASSNFHEMATDIPELKIGDAERKDDGGAAIAHAASNFHAMAPDIPALKIEAAVGIRLQELDEYTRRYGNRVPTSESLYTTLISRAVGLSEDVTAILPMHDMLNHSDDPNVGLAFAEDGTIQIVASRDIPQGEELFLRYKDVRDEDGKWDEDKAAWLLCQWGIPSSPLDVGQSRTTNCEQRDQVKQQLSI